MENSLHKYFANELSAEEKDEFLKVVEENEELREEFIDFQQLAALLDWLPQLEDGEFARARWLRFIREREIAERE